ncbi:hypothetical protein H5410_050410 [Solanum commersonii]|uniref:Uncharacterized protein n=1 Tax=Solanum commersonii TaxID=4109 RepID=A0A9J5WWQ5_SOLCO|nr:hypothetical protein H5410_050410 [Solanum commersonii]
MSLQYQALSFSVGVEGRQVKILVQNPTFLAQVVSEGSSDDVNSLESSGNDNNLLVSLVETKKQEHLLKYEDI